MVKEFMKNKKAKYVVVALLVVILASFGITVALMNAKTNEVVNDFTIGEVTTNVYEETGEAIQDGEFVKKVWVKSTGPDDCLVRARVDISPKEADVTNLIAYNTGTDAGDWYDGGDGFYYYIGYLKGTLNNPAADGSEQITKNTLFDKVNFSQVTNLENIKDIQVTVYQEAVPTEIVIDEAGTELHAINADGSYNKTAASGIWAYFDGKSKGDGSTP
ncbi:hypothetical protein M2145_001403 [Lachnospiraceae bacterium PF1-21]